MCSLRRDLSRVRDSPRWISPSDWRSVGPHRRYPDTHEPEIQMLKLAVILAVLACSSMASAECRIAPSGRKVCSNGQAAAAYNPRTGNAATAAKNQNGVTTTQSSRGGEAKTKNGMGVYKAPNGTTCVKGKNGQGCR
jgi:hypothetical protein